jgi:hypothetical protein
MSLKRETSPIPVMCKKIVVRKRPMPGSRITEWVFPPMRATQGSKGPQPLEGERHKKADTHTKRQHDAHDPARMDQEPQSSIASRKKRR